MQLAALQWTTIEVQPREYQHFPTNALYFLRFGDIPFVACLFSENDTRAWDFDEDVDGIVTRRGERLQVFARSLEDAAAAVNFVISEAGARSVYRGKMLHVSPPRAKPPGAAGEGR